MNQSIQFLSRWDFKKLLNAQGLRKDTAYISINDTPTECEDIRRVLAQHQHEGAHHCIFRFRDVDRESMGGMTDEDARALLAFIKANAERHFIVHCFQGISRSAAVARFINDYLGVRNRQLERYPNYNRLVYDKLMAAAGLSLSAHYAAQEEASTD